MKLKFTLILVLLTVVSVIGLAQQNTTQWSLYHDDELSFEIRYPKDWKVERWYDGKFGIVIDFTGPLHKEKFSGKTLEVQDSFSIDVLDQDDNKIKTIKQWVNKYHLSPNNKKAKDYRFENFNLNGHKALAIRYQDGRFPLGDGHKVVIDGRDTILILHNNQVYSFSYPYDQLKKQMLRTFRFTK